MVMENESFNVTTIHTLNKAILEDEFDDKTQNVNNYEGVISGNDVLKSLLRHESLDSMKGLNVGAASHELPGDWYNLEPCPQRATEKTIQGWSENIPTNVCFDLIICWGTLCFVRSLPETLVQFNLRLLQNGRLYVDIVRETVMPLAQTVHGPSFIRYMSLFGFSLCEYHHFGHETHQRTGFRFEKVREFDYRYLRIPQCTGKVNNFLWERDWYLQ